MKYSVNLAVFCLFLLAFGSVIEGSEHATYNRSQLRMKHKRWFIKSVVKAVKKQWNKTKKIINKGKQIVKNVGTGVYAALKRKIFRGIEKKWRSNGTFKNCMFKKGHMIKYFSIKMAKYYETLAGFGYCSPLRIIKGKCCNNFIKREHWKLAGFHGISFDNYKFSILRNDVLKKVVISFPGTLGIKQLLKQFIDSHGDPFRGSRYMKVVSYFNDMYLRIRSKVHQKIKKVHKRYPHYQYVCTGHSLGGAMATVFCLDLVLGRHISKTEHSPVLISYGAPRVGNDFFAEAVMKNIPHVFRIVRKGDLISMLPPCNTHHFGTSCRSNLVKHKFLNRSRKVSIRGFYAWHIGGLKLFNRTMKRYNQCGTKQGDNHSDKRCHLYGSYDFDLHKYYFNSKKVSKICRD